MALYHVGVVRSFIGGVTVEADSEDAAVEAADRLADGKSSEELDRLFTVDDEEWQAGEDSVWRES
jgi:hypothetical protein